MKRIFCTLIIFCLIFNYGFAEEERKSDLINEFIFEISDKEVLKQNDEHAIVSFTITNPTDDYYPDLFYIPSLHVLVEEAGYYFSQKYIEYDPVKFDLYANETRSIIYELDFPDKLSNMRYAVGFKISAREHTLSLNDELIYLKDIRGSYNGFLIPVEKNYLEIEGKNYKPNSGPTVSDKEKVNAVINVESTFLEDKIVIPQINIFRRDIASNNIPVLTTYGDAITVKAGEKKEISLEIPVMSLSESYVAKITFIDESNKRVSAQYDFRYVVAGVSANISEIKAKQTEDNIEVITTIVGPADASELENVDVICEVYNGDVKISDKKLNTSIGPELLDIKLVLNSFMVEKNTIVTLKISVKYEGKEIASKEQELKLIATDVKGERLTDIKGTKYEEAVIALNGLGILSGYPDGTFRPENTITRAEFASIATKLGEYKVQDIENSMFSDVVKEHWAKNYINTCADKGIVSGYLDGTFKPDNKVNYAESITILLNILGYRTEVNSTEMGWPDNYLKKSSDLRIHNQSDYSDYFLPATRGDIAILTYNAYLRR